MTTLFCQGCRVVQRAATPINKSLWRNVITTSRHPTSPSRSVRDSRKPERGRQLLCPYQCLLVVSSMPCRGFNDVRLTDRVTSTDILSILTEHRLPFKEGHTGYLTSCKNCNVSSDDLMMETSRKEKRPRQRRLARKKRPGEDVVHEEYRGNKTDLPLFIGLYTGDCVCISCGTKHDWQGFKRMHEYLDSEHGKGIVLPGVERETFYDDDLTTHTSWTITEPIDEESYAQARLNHVELKNIPLEVLQKFRVRCCVNGNLLVFPYFDLTGEKLVGFKVYDCLGNGRGEIVKNEGRLHSCFGWHMLKTDTVTSKLEKLEYVVLTDSEINAIAIMAATGYTALSLPCGVSSLPNGCLPFLEPFGELILWFSDEDGDVTNRHVQRLARKLGLSRCQLVRCRDGDESLSQLLVMEGGAEVMKECLTSREPMAHDHLITFQNIRTQVFSEIRNAKKNSGVQFKRFPGLNDYLGGHRCGELTILTGPTGSGKTTFMSELSLDLCTSGVRTLWGSFEVKNVRLATTMLHQFSGISLKHHIERVGEWSERFERLPMYFMDYYGQRDLDEVLQTIEYAVYMYDIEHVIIDNLQFMIHPKPYQDKFAAMDEAITKFRSCASEHGVHITVVVHPRKEDIGAQLSTMSISGTAKASQEADNVLILQSTDEKSIEVTKNRYSGGIGMVPLKFVLDSKCMSGYYREPDSDKEILPNLGKRERVQNIDVRKTSKKNWKSR